MISGLIVMILTISAIGLSIWAVRLMARNNSVGVKFVFGMFIMVSVIALWLMDLMFLMIFLGF